VIWLSVSRTQAVGVWIGFTTMCVGMFMAILDVQVVATSLPAIQGALGMAPAQMSWVQTAYLIAEVIAIPLTGFLTRLLSMRWLFVTSVCVFTLASTGCATSGGFGVLVAWRVLQGFSGGTLIPAVFSAVFLLFPVRRQGVATMLAGVLAVLAPSVGPIVGGWITWTYSWHWLFLINVPPGILTAILASALLPRGKPDLRELRTLDLASLIMMAMALTALEIALKEAPQFGWTSGLAMGMLTLSLTSAAGFIGRTRQSSHKIVDLGAFADRNFTIGCILSFVLGIGLFGSVYLIPVYLAFVRYHDALEIGGIMLVTGVTQLLTAPMAVMLEQRLDPRLLTAAGFGTFAVGLGLSALQTPQTDYDGMFWPQIIRGLAIMFCLLPPTRLALGALPTSRVPDASGLFNLMRNLGGAIGIAVIDSVIYGRSASHGVEIMDRLRAGDLATARFAGLSTETFAARVAGPLDANAQEMLRPIIERAALTQSINESWALIALLTIAAMICVPFSKRSLPPPREDPPCPSGGKNESDVIN
jgi:DHA2 family multidrug resistance protein